MKKEINEAASALKSKLRGELILPSSESYHTARKVWNGMFDCKPALIVRCIGNSDVIHCVNFARENGLLVSVKGGGHNSAGTAVCDDGMMIDLSLMRNVQVDEKSKTVRVGGGALWGDVDHETQRFGWAVPAGIVSHTGVGGLTLGGGFGWISRKHGLTVDNLVSAQIVTPEGKLVTASAEENPDLYWGIRGGGGNFGVVTSFVFKCADIGTEVYSGIVVKKFENARAYMQFHRQYVRAMPDEMTIWMVIRKAPPLPFIPAEYHGKLVVLVPFVWLGDEKEGAAFMDPVRNATETVGENLGMHPWLGWQSAFDGLVGHGARNYWKSHQLTDLSDGCIDQVLRFAASLPTDECEVFLPHLEGAPSRIALDATAYSHRTPPFNLNIHTRWQNTAEDEKCLAWAQSFHDATRPYAEGVYVNFLSAEGEERVKEAYRADVWERLVKIKTKYDPDNLFRMNQNIRPATRTSPEESYALA